VSDLEYSVDGHIGRIVLNRPERRNAISAAMLDGLTEALLEADRDPQVRVLILTGAGKGFCAGMDIKDAMAGRGIGGSGPASPSGGAAHFQTRDLPTVALHEIDTPVICAINGAAAGYGMDLALGCDIRLMSEEARLVPAFARRGIVPESGGTWYLPRLVGWARACEIGFLADEIPAARAVELGLVNKTVPADRLEEEATQWARKIADNAPLAIAAMKRLFRHGLTEDFSSHSHHVLMQLLLLFRSEDFREGLSSFAEKRPARFRGK
jgi:enoyl-CoA hydratase/carnithine racemase